MKKFLENNAVGLFVSVLAASLVIIGLCGWIYLDFRGDENRDLLYETEAESAAYRLMDSLEAGDVILSYHYARLVRDNAARSGGHDAAHTSAASCVRRKKRKVSRPVCCKGETHAVHPFFLGF